MVATRTHKPRTAETYTVVVWMQREAETGIPDVWNIQATYPGQALLKIKKHYKDEDWPEPRAIRVKKASGDFQRIL